jgi:serine/threonine protein kinase
MDKYIGRLLDERYEILEIIGVGGMAVVYKAMDHRLNRLVAVKILKDDYTNDADLRRRFHNESQAVAMMSHPNIVSVYDVSRNEDVDFIVMELIDGITLTNGVKSYTIPDETKFECGIGVSYECLDTDNYAWGIIADYYHTFSHYMKNRYSISSVWKILF